MLNEKDLMDAKGLYGITYIYGELSVRWIRELDDMMSRASEKQMTTITFQDDPEGARKYREAAERDG